MTKEKIKVFTGSGSFNIQDEMLKDSKGFMIIYFQKNI